MEEKRFGTFGLMMILLTAIAILGVGLLVYGGITYEPAPAAQPWTVAGSTSDG